MDKLESLKQAIRATLTSAKNGQTLPELRRSFIDLGIRPNPFEVLKISEVEFFKKYPDVGRMEIHNAVPVFFGIPTESDKHIHRMVQQQKKGKVKSLNKRIETAKRYEFKGVLRSSASNALKTRRLGTNRSGSFSRNSMPSKMALNEIRTNRSVASGNRSTMSSRFSSHQAKSGFGEGGNQKENHAMRVCSQGRGSPQVPPDAFSKSTRPESVAFSRNDNIVKSSKSSYSPGNDFNSRSGFTTPSMVRGKGIDPNRGRLQTSRRDGFPNPEKQQFYNSNDNLFRNGSEKQKWSPDSGRDHSFGRNSEGSDSFRNSEKNCRISSRDSNYESEKYSLNVTEKVTRAFDDNKRSLTITPKESDEQGSLDKRSGPFRAPPSKRNGFEPPDKIYETYRSKESDSTDNSIFDPAPRKTNNHFQKSNNESTFENKSITIKRTFDDEISNNSASKREISFERIRASIEKLDISDNQKVDSIEVKRISQQEDEHDVSIELGIDEETSMTKESEHNDELDDLGDHLRQLALRNKNREPEFLNNFSRAGSDSDCQNDSDSCNESRELFKSKQSTLSACRRMITNHLALNKRRVMSSLTSERSDKFNADIVNYNDIKCGTNLSKEFVEDILVLLSEIDNDIPLESLSEVYRKKFKIDLNMRRHRVENARELCEKMSEIVALYEESDRTYIKCLYIRNADEKLAGIFRRRDSNKNPQKESSPIKIADIPCYEAPKNVNADMNATTPYKSPMGVKIGVAYPDGCFQSPTFGNQVYISGIPLGTTELELRTSLWDYGFVDKVSMKLGYAFVTFSSDAEASAVVDKRFLDLRGTKIECTRCKARNELVHPVENFKTEVNENLVYVKSVPVFWSDSKLKEVFSIFGTVTSAVNKKKGFGFVYFKSRDETAKAVRQGSLLVQNVLLIIEQGKC